RCVALQPLALKALPSGIRAKTRVIYQSAPTPRGRGPGARSGRFEVLVAAHLRAVKDPLRAARASRTLPPESRVRVLHAGAALSPDWALRAEAEMRRNPRYRWLGVLPPLSARRRIAAARLLIVSSRLEGGPNVISEAAVNGVPVLATRVSGNVGLLGAGYGGYFAAGDTAGLARLLRRAETDPTFLTRLRRQVRVQARLFTPRREREAWRRLLREMTAGGGG
ncbi:MAG: glycosyltransferase, partial [Terriglobales bacterium]